MTSDNALTLAVLDGTFAIHRLRPAAEIPPEILRQSVFSVMRRFQPPRWRPYLTALEQVLQRSWRGLVIEGTLDFGMTGVLAAISNVLAAAQVSIFALSTYDTDYIFVKADKLKSACEALRQAGYGLRDGAELA